MFAAACGQPAEQDSTALTPTPAATVDSATAPAATPSPAPTATPPIAAWTGIEELDEIIRLELAGDGKALADRLQMRREPCSFHPELGYPPLCRDDEAEGQMVEVFPEGHCEGFDQRPEKAREEVAAVHPKTEFYAALAPSPPQEGTETGYWLVFDYTSPTFPGGFTYVVRGDRIVSWFAACNGVDAGERARSRLLAVTNTGIAADRSTRIAPLDGIIAAVEGGSADPLTARLVYRDSHCSQRYSPGDGLYCLPGEADGSKLHLFAADGCVSALLRDSDAEALLTAAVEGGTPPRFYAIGLASPTEAQAFTYRLFFAHGDGADARGFELQVLDGRIVRFDSACGPIARRAATLTTFLVPPDVPASRADPDAVTTIGLTDVDEIAQLVTSGDMAAIVKRIKTTVVPCGRPGDSFGRVDCGSEAPGTPIESVATGHRAYESVVDAVRFHLAAQALSLYSVSRISPVGNGECGKTFAPSYTLTFSWVSSPPFEGLALVSIVVGGGEIVAIGGGCDIGWPPDVAAGYILRPPDER